MKKLQTNYLSRLTEQYDKLLLDLINEDLKIAKDFKSTFKLSVVGAARSHVYFKKN